MTVASTGLIAALTTSIGTPANGWIVTNVQNSDAYTSQTSVSGTGGTTISTSTTADTTTTTISLEAPKLRVAVGSTKAMTLQLVSVSTGSTLVSGGIICDGAYLYLDPTRSADRTLNTTILGLASTFLTAKDASLIAGLNAGPQVVANAISSDLLAALNATLVDPTAQWTVRSRLDNAGRTATGSPATQTTVVIGSLAIKIDPLLTSNPGRLIPAQFLYIATVDTLQVFVSAQVSLNGAWWTSTDSTLQATIMSMAAAYTAAQSASLTAAINAGPQP